MLSVLAEYGLNEKSSTLELIGSGLINVTWKVTSQEGPFILQKINKGVFKIPEDITENIRLIADYLKQVYPDYLFIAPAIAINGNETVIINDETFRLFPFIAGSHSKSIVASAEQAYQAASQFGRFTKLLRGFDASQLKITIPHFHDLALRYQEFLGALNKGNRERIQQSESLIKRLKGHSDIVREFKSIQSNPEFKLRATHHDTKISNVLFDEHENGICVIDLDTVMPGYFISDIGDMIRTYVSAVSEEEPDFDKIVIREEYFAAVIEGYFKEIKSILTPAEKKYIFYAGEFMVYMQALRFLTDYLSNDIYYDVLYPQQNFVRAGNQIMLLQKLIKEESRLKKSLPC